MKRKNFRGVIAFMVVLFARQIAFSQGTLTYLSSLGQPSVGSAAVGEDSWVASIFMTGGNLGGYELDSVELAMTPASGAPSDFTVMLYSSGPEFSAVPVSRLDTLSGPTDPTTGGDYTYTASDLTLSKGTPYFIVITAGTPVASGAYAWSYTDSAPANTMDLWQGGNALITSSDGVSWNVTLGDGPQFAINATAIPEPKTFFLLVLGCLIFGWEYNRAKTQAPR
jgi:hypothetical protein